MGTIAIACYKPKPGCDEQLLDLVREHMIPLRAEGFATETTPIVGQAADGTIVEIFEWVSDEAIQAAHSNPAVLDLWERFDKVSEYVSPASLPDLQQLFGNLKAIS